MAYQYPLQKIVDLKASERNQAEWQLSEAINQRNLNHSRLQDLQQQSEQLQTEIMEQSTNCISVMHIQMFQSQMEYLDRMIQYKRKEVLQAEKVVDKRQQRLGQKMMDEKIWTKAKEQAHEAYVAMSLRREQSELDELASRSRGGLL